MGIVPSKILQLLWQIVVYTSLHTLKFVVYIFCAKPYIIRASVIIMKGLIQSKEQLCDHKKIKSEQTLAKTAYLSYYISMYNSVSQQIGFDESAPITAQEIYDFMQDLKHEAGEYVPNITKEDINFSLYVLQAMGICREDNELGVRQSN